MRALYLNKLLARLDRKAETTGNPNDYEEAIQLAREALAMMPYDHPDQANG
jgi:hypothetical protein